jgi:hypothetical protein
MPWRRKQFQGPLVVLPRDFSRSQPAYVRYSALSKHTQFLESKQEWLGYGEWRYRTRIPVIYKIVWIGSGSTTQRLR